MISLGYVAGQLVLAQLALPSAPFVGLPCPGLSFLPPLLAICTAHSGPNLKANALLIDKQSLSETRSHDQGSTVKKDKTKM